MSILTDDIVRSGNDGTIYKLIVIRVLLYQPEVKMRVNHSGIRATGYGIHYIVGNGSIGHTFQNFRIFIQYIIAYAKHIPSFTESLPCRSVLAVDRDYLHQAIGIKDDVSVHC